MTAPPTHPATGPTPLELQYSADCSAEWSDPAKYDPDAVAQWATDWWTAAQPWTRAEAPVMGPPGMASDDPQMDNTLPQPEGAR